MLKCKKNSDQWTFSSKDIKTLAFLYYINEKYFIHQVQQLLWPQKPTGLSKTIAQVKKSDWYIRVHVNVFACEEGLSECWVLVNYVSRSSSSFLGWNSSWCSIRRQFLEVCGGHGGLTGSTGTQRRVIGMGNLTPQGAASSLGLLKF